MRPLLFWARCGCDHDVEGLGFHRRGHRGPQRTRRVWVRDLFAGETQERWHESQRYNGSPKARLRLCYSTQDAGLKARRYNDWKC